MNIKILEELNLPCDLLEALKAEGITPEQCDERESDLQVKCSCRAQAVRLKQAGIWDAMTDVFQSEAPEDNPAWFAEFGLALLDYNLKQKREALQTA